MNPSLSAINEALLVSADYFIVPTAPDNFSTLAIRSLAKVLPKWEQWAVRARDVFEDASYPLPRTTPRFLGTVIQRFNIRKGRPTNPSQVVIARLSEAVKTTLIEALRDVNMTLPVDAYSEDDFCLAKIPDFQALNALYQTYGIPVFALSDDQLGHVGTVLAQYQITRTRFHGLFSDFADTIIAMTGHA
jgi:cellulose biosynthesis protein BcsQ